MTDRIIDIKTGMPREIFYDATITPLSQNVHMGEFMELEKSYDEMHAELCASVKDMLTQSAQILSMLIEIAGRDEKLLRSLRWDNFMTIPVALRPIRSKLTWLEDFFKREPRR